MLVGRIKPLDDLATSQRLGRSGPEPVADLIDHPLRRLPRLRVHGRLARTLPSHIHAPSGGYWLLRSFSVAPIYLASREYAWRKSLPIQAALSRGHRTLWTLVLRLHRDASETVSAGLQDMLIVARHTVDPGRCH